MQGIKPKELKKGILLLIAATIVMSLLFEGFFRLFDPQLTPSQAIIYSPSVFAKSEYLPWQLKPFASDIHTSQFGEFKVNITINSQGMRDYEHKIAKNGAERILALGDSFTYGYGVELNETYSKVLESELKKGAKQQYEVLNAGYASGYSPDTYLLYLKKEGIKFQPDIILVGFTIGNDVTDLFKNRAIADNGTAKIVSDSYYVDGENRLRRPPYGKQSGLIALLSAHSHFFVFIKNSISQFFQKPHKENDVYEVEYGEELKEKWGEVEKILIEMNGLANQHNAALVIVLIPRKAQLYDEDWKAYQEAYSNYEVDRAKPQKLLSGICSKNAIKCIDLYPSFKREAKEEFYFKKDGHWTKEGHEFAAKHIKQELLKMGIVKDAK